MGFMDKIKDAANQAVADAKQSVSDAKQSAESMKQAAVDDPYGSAPAYGAPAYASPPAYGAPAAPVERPIVEVTSHIDGKNAKVRVFVDRIEWERPKSVSGAKVGAAMMTGGLSLAVSNGVKSRAGAGTEVIYMDSVTSVTTKRDTMFNDCVSVITAGNTIDFRVSKSEAESLKAAILNARTALRQPSQPAPTYGYAPPPAPAAELSLADKLKQLADLHAAGVLSDAEFAAAKASALGI